MNCGGAYVALRRRSISRETTAQRTKEGSAMTIFEEAALPSRGAQRSAEAEAAPLGVILYHDSLQMDAFLAEAARELQASGLRLGGVVQSNAVRNDGARCDMSLVELFSGEEIRLSQNLGAGARGCKLDPAGLVQAASLIERALAAGVDLLIINKFGKQEGSGRGLRSVIGEALATGVPVLLGVSSLNLDACREFAGACFTALPAEMVSVLKWCEANACR